jgi:hypothetical protein
VDVEDCPGCEANGDACPEHAKEIHESWHLRGMFWVRFEQCSPSCPGWAETVEMGRKQRLEHLTPRERAQLRQIELNGPPARYALPAE